MQHNQTYPPSSRYEPQPQPQRHNSFPQWQVNPEHYHSTYQHGQVPNRRMSDRPPDLPQNQIYSPHAVRATTVSSAHVSFDPTHTAQEDDSSMYPHSHDTGISDGHKISNNKKRPRQISIPASSSASVSATPQINEDTTQTQTPTPMKTVFWNSKSPTTASSSSARRESEPTKHSTQVYPTTISISVPSVLTREKKQKACTNCRKAKLKCILEQGSQECVRCKVRKEKCIFFPRSQEDEVQQKLTRDVYDAATHLSQLSKAVHHILHHLTERKVIPPFTCEEYPDGLDKYDPPERPKIPSQGNEHNVNQKESGGEAKSNGTSKKRRKVANKSENREVNDVDELEEEEESVVKQPTTGEITSTGSSASSSMPSVLQGSTSSITRSHGHTNGVNGSYHASNPSTIITRPPSTMVSSPPLTSSSTRLPPPLIPPNRPSSSTPPLPASPIDSTHIVHPSIGQVLSASGEGWNIGQPPQDIEMRSISPRTRMSSPPVLTTSYIPNPYPTNPHMNIDPLPSHMDPSSHSSLSTHDGHTVTPDSQVGLEAIANEEVDMIIGSQDPRKDIVKKGLVDPKDALSLVNYFHKSISPLLYGYPLQFYRFPYIAGPGYITPLLLSVLCLISSERLSSFHKRYHHILAEEVTNLLQTSPAESWQRFEGGYTADFGDPEGDEPLDAEFGLGPEEIVAACMLATYMTQREQASVIARSAFRWARGWIKLLKSSTTPRFTIAASVGLVPPERQATDLDMARIWLLCYIVDSTERLQLSLDAPPPRDALSFCYMLIPPTNYMGQHQTQARTSRQDILLTFHARLISILNKWRHKFKSLISATQPSEVLVEQLKSLARGVNDELRWWESEFEGSISRSPISSSSGSTGESVIGSSKQHIMITFHFVRMSVNSTLSKYLPSSSPSTTGFYGMSEFEERQMRDWDLRVRAKRIVVESAMTFLNICRDWSTPWSLFNLSPTYLFFLTLMGSELVDVVREGKECGVEVKADDVIPLLKAVGEMLFLGELDEQHVSRTTAKTLFVYCEKLQGLR
uniref:Zn(2)-C6 fungal-type domain-containing protein n=1 Tax=Kwoniella bestiolae CBS 10118 TaxID=1296100 RepID=A0A1B9GBH4_9TREE|nr:hypothetical protein I302_03223 [Kwoniella bestiolae CBS 10118]OCF28364.1 hypothetical protein I302_03223 [Kwoniella bestiolae CBS 10118]